MKTWFARLIAPRPTFGQDMTAAERQLMQEHGVYWRGLLDQRQVAVFGMVGDPKGVFGMGVFELADDVDPKTLTDRDPVIRANAGFRYEILPMPFGAVHR